jgi:hypothetical protein
MRMRGASLYLLCQSEALPQADESRRLKFEPLSNAVAPGHPQSEEEMLPHACFGRVAERAANSEVNGSVHDVKGGLERNHLIIPVAGSPPSCQ